MAQRSSRFLKLFVFFVAVTVVLWATHTLWMTALGQALVRDDGPVHADAAVVLAGDFNGNRILRGGELVKEGYVPKVLVSGPHMVYGLHECDVAIPYAVEHGYKESWFVPVKHEALSTWEEGQALTPILRSMGVHSILLVTSNYHTARAARIFHAAAPDFEIHTVPAPDRYFKPAGWWKTREGQKIFVGEWTRTVASALGI